MPHHPSRLICIAKWDGSGSMVWTWDCAKLTSNWCKGVAIFIFFGLFDTIDSQKMTLAMSFCHKRADLLLDIWLLYFVVFFTEGKFSFFMFTITSPHALLCYIVWSEYFLVLLCFSFLFLLFLFLFWVCSVNSCGSLSLFMRKILKGIQLFLLLTFISTLPSP